MELHFLKSLKVNCSNTAFSSSIQLTNNLRTETESLKSCTKQMVLNHSKYHICAMFCYTTVTWWSWKIPWCNILTLNLVKRVVYPWQNNDTFSGKQYFDKSKFIWKLKHKPLINKKNSGKQCHNENQIPVPFYKSIILPTNSNQIADYHSADIRLLKVNNENSNIVCEICSKLIIKTRRVTLNILHTLYWCFRCWIWTSKLQLGYPSCNTVKVD